MKLPSYGVRPGCVETLHAVFAGIQLHVDEGGSPFGGESSTDGVLAPSDQHMHTAIAQVPA